MDNIIHSLIWAGGILGAALICSIYGLSDGASFAVIAGLTGAALSSIDGDSCARSCS